MVIDGRVQNGVVVLAAGTSLPEGTAVTVVVPNLVGDLPQIGTPSAFRVRLPLVPSLRPGSRVLTAENIAELLEDEDVSS